MKLNVLLIVFLFCAQALVAQIHYKVDAVNSLVVIKGTSSIHDWEMKAGSISGGFSLQEGTVFQGKLNTGSLVVPVVAIKSDHSLMNKKTYEALKEKAHPQIKIRLIGAEQNAQESNVQIELSIAGKSKMMHEKVLLKDLGNGKVEIKGALNLKMSDFAVEPPVALMGTIKTGDAIVVNYQLIFSKEGQLFGETNKSTK